MSSKKIILFESYPDFTGSPLEIYKELLKRGYDKKYELIWAIDKKEKYINTEFKTINFFGESKYRVNNILKNVKIIIDSNRYIYKNSNNYRLHTRHGTNLKRMEKYSNSIGDVDCLLSLSDEMKKIDAIVYPKIKTSKIISLGLPANDVLFNDNNEKIHNFVYKILNKKYDKIIGWFPTYRQKFINPNKGLHTIFKYGVPNIENEEQLLKLNDTLKSKNVLLLIQIHHAQAKNYSKIENLSNIFVLEEDIIKKYNLNLLELITSLDALITDYSSIYFEFLLLNKPIALCVEDLVEYNKKFGFWYNYLEWIKGEYIISFNNLLNFVKDVTNDVDNSKDTRLKIMNKIHKYKDNKSAERVVDYLEKIGQL